MGHQARPRVLYPLSSAASSTGITTSAVVSSVTETRPRAKFGACHYKRVHKRFYGRRTDWFEHFEGPSVVLWWVPVGHRPSVEEAVA
ncbi:DUF3291 domain-containing protein, partial [Bradyrhizobium sp.]|uniref:DUF3291 domain-containing protein n=1 Tax=Bradyrhizobium sp. TaxID=376 RepID=UPI003C29EEF9